MRVPGLQKGGAPWRGEWGDLGEEKQVLWLRPSVPELTLCSFQSLSLHGIWDRAQSALRGLGGWAERARSSSHTQDTFATLGAPGAGRPCGE